MISRSSYVLFLLSFLFTAIESFSQPTFWGMTMMGGPTDVGVVFKMKTDGTGFTPVHNFEAVNDGRGIGSLGMVLASDGLFYGATTRGGTHDMGVLFSFDENTEEYVKKIDFTPQTGAYSYGALMQASNGKIYGTTQWEGANGYGTFFEYDINANTLTVKYSWEAGSGEATASFGVVAGDDGLLYGTRMTWGSARKGLIFRYNPANGVYTERYHFTDDNTGRRPNGLMTKLADGTFLGVTESGGIGGNGTVYHYNPVTNVHTKKADVGANGAYPVGFLTKANNGKFYGLTQSGGSEIGTLFEYDHSNSTYTRKFSFTSAYGLRPSGKLIVESGGRIWGKTTEGGEHPDHGGTLFSYTAGTSDVTKHYDFGGQLGSKPYGSIEMVHANSTIMGSTSEGGAGNSGVLFQYYPGGDEMRVVRTLHQSLEGDYPISTFTQGPSGKLLATLRSGGDHGKGVVFEIDTKTNGFKRLADFTGANGSEPFGQMLKAADGNYYGVTFSGGDHDGGVLFRFDYATKQLTPVFHFDNESGYNSQATLTTDGWSEMLYGVTVEGGDNGNGTIFRYDVFGNVFTKIHDFAPNYSEAGAGLLLHDYTLYGVCNEGGAHGYGAIYKINVSGTQFTALHDFNSDAHSEGTPLLRTSDGKMYGTLSEGGQFGGGVLFRFDPQSSQFTILKNFDEVSGMFPLAPLTEGKGGKLFGLTMLAGTHLNGTIFSYDPASTNFAVVQNFDRSNGSWPANTGLFIEKAAQHIAALPQEIVFSADAVQLPLNSDAGLTVRYETDNDAVFSANNNVLTMNSPGVATLIATQKGNVEYFPADTVYQSLTIVLGTPVATAGTAISIAGFTTHWTGVYGAASYMLDVSKDNFTTYVTGYEHKSVSNLSQVLTGLQAGTQYQYRVKAVGASAQSAYSQTITVSTTAIPVTPVAPVALAATDIKTTSFVGKWNSVPQATSYELDVSKDNFATFVQPYQAKSLTSLSQEISNLTPNTNYQYRVRAVNASGKSVSSNVVSASTAQLQAQQILFNTLSDKKIGDGDFVLTATSTSGLPVVITTTSTAIQINGNTVKILKAGKVAIRATQAGNEIFLAAQPVERVFCVLPAKPTISVSSPATDGAVVVTSSAENNNRWFKDAEMIDTKTSITVKTNGTYTVEVSIDGCTGERSLPYNHVVTSLELQGERTTFTVHPNPAKDFVTITTDHDTSYTLRILHADGRMVYENDHDESSLQIDVSGFSSGVYLVEVIAGKQRKVARVVKY